MMAKIEGDHTDVVFEVVLRLTESECRALEAIAGYGVEAFMTRFYETLGRAYLAPHQSGVKTLFDTVRVEVSPRLRSVERIRKKLKEDNRLLKIGR